MFSGLALRCKRTQRCAPANAGRDTGARDLTLPRKLLQTLDHSDYGIYVKGVSGFCMGIRDKTNNESVLSESAQPKRSGAL